ncbi:MAG: Ig-like domain-containing protein, partial [Lachnospiraceae bacterium]|nr:Ig-like domain-containing protein [Lachnospiraceae bacterium]
SIEGGTISIWYKGGSLGDEWTDTLPADAGTYSVAVDYSQVGSYSAAEKLTDDSWKFTVTPKDISGAVLTGIEGSYDHTGEALEPAPVVSVQLKDGGVTLVKDTDYTVSYTDNVNKGTAKVTVTGKGNYTGSVIKTFEIVIRVTGIDIENSKLYLKPGEKAVLNAVVMPEDANDRSVSWSSSNDSVATVSEGEVTGVSAGDAIISAVTKDGAFKAEAVVTVLSEGENVPDSDIYGDEEEYEKAKEEAGKEGRELGLWIAGDFRQEYVYTGAAIKPLPNVYYGTKLLIQGSDYTVKYKNNTNAASLTDSKAPEITVKGKGIYSGSDTENFAITKASFEDDRDDFAISDIAIVVKNTKAQKPVPKITYMGKNLSAKKDFTVIYRVGGQESDSVSLDEGETKKEFEAVIKATDSGNYTGETVVTGCLYLKGESDVTALPISKLKFTASPAACVYDGAEQKPSFTASYNSKDVSFERSEDDAEDYFDTVYGNNVDQGKGKMTISGKAVYTATDGSKYVFTGNKTLTFKIDRFDLKDAEIVFSSVEQNEDGSYTGVLPYEKAGAKPGVLVSFTGKVTADDGSVSEEKVYLQQGRHYKVKYKYTDKDKTGITVTVSGTGNFTGSKALSGTAAAVTLRENAVAVAEDVISGKDPSKVSVKVYDEYGTLLKKGKDYVYDPQTDISEDESQSAEDEGEKTYTLTLHGVGVYAANEGGDLTCSFKSYDKAYKFASAKQLTKPEKNYTGSAVELTEEDLTGMLGHKEKDKLVPGTDFEVVVYQKNVKPGTAKAILRGLGQFGGSKTITFKIQKRAF